MPTANLNNAETSLDTSNDGIVIVEHLSGKVGGATLNVSGFTPSVIPAGHVVIKETSTGDLKPMPVVEASSGNVATVGSVTAGTGYTNGTYENVPLSGGSGTGVLATVVVASTVVSTVTITQGGKDYKVADVLAVPAAFAGGTGSGGSVPVATLGTTAAAYSALPSGHTYSEYVTVASVLTAKPFVGLMDRGTVNPSAQKYAIASILTAVKTAQPQIIYRAD